MRRKHSRDEILNGALEAALEEGLSQLTFGRLAARLGINDRMLVYYFPTKDELISEVLRTMGVRLQKALAEAFSGPASDHKDLVRMAWPVLTRPQIERLFALFLEVNGLASAGREPYRSLVTRFVGSWVDWAASMFEGTDQERTTEAEAAIALIDGLLLLRQIAGPESGNRAAHRFGVV